MNGDGVPDIVTGAGPGGGPEVRAFDGITGSPLPGSVGGFFAYDPRFTGGVFVAAGRGLIGGGAKVAVLDRQGFVDTTDSAHIQASLAALGHSVSTFTGNSTDEVVTALTGKDVLVIPPILGNTGGFSTGFVDLGPARRFVAAGWSDRVRHAQLPGHLRAQQLQSHG